MSIHEIYLCADETTFTFTSHSLSVSPSPSPSSSLSLCLCLSLRSTVFSARSDCCYFAWLANVSTPISIAPAVALTPANLLQVRPPLCKCSDSRQMSSLSAGHFKASLLHSVSLPLRMELSRTKPPVNPPRRGYCKSSLANNMRTLLASQNPKQTSCR